MVKAWSSGTDSRTAVVFDIFDGVADLAADAITPLLGLRAGAVAKRPARATVSPVEIPKVEYTKLTHCVDCKKTALSTLTSEVHTATIWNGNRWSRVQHGQKRCYECGSIYNLNYRPQIGSKANTLQCPEDSDIVLLNPFVGFEFAYLRQFWNRTCRASISARAEAATILLTWPDNHIGNRRKGRATRNQQYSEFHFSQLITTATFVYLRLQDKDYDFDVADPMPDHHPLYGKPNKGAYVLFNAVRDDPGFTLKRKAYDIVTDGDQPLRRKLGKGEHTTKKLPGAPNKRKMKRAIEKKPAGSGVAQAKSVCGGRTSISRCLAVERKEKIAHVRNRTGGLFASLDMKQASSHGGNEILSLVEMLDGESTYIKEEALKDMLRTGMRVGVYAHDCACRVKARFEGVYCKECRLDGLHGLKHKCKVKSVIHDGSKNSQAAEQLWGRLDKFSFATELSRCRYRYFFKCYAQWRNNFVRLARLSVDVAPMMSRRRLQRHGRR